jgi:type I restriction enzyme S subunit
MKEGWEYKKLGEVATFINGFAFKPSQWVESGIPIIRIQNLNNPAAPFNYFDGDVPHKYLVIKGDILISWSASLGAYEWTGENAYLNQHIFKVVFDKADIDKHFLKYAVTSKLSEMDKDAHGATMRHIVKKDFDNTKIPFPPLSEQQHIVEELDLLSSIIEKKKAQLNELDHLAQSLFYEMFGDPIANEKGWEKCKLEDVCDVRDGTHDSPKYVVESDYVLITSKNIQDGEVSFENVNYITKEDYDKINMRSYVDDGDIIMAMIGTIGKPIIVKKEGRKFCIKNVALIKFKNSNCIINTYVKAMLDNPTYMDYVHSLNRGGTQKFVSLKTIRNLSVLLPSMDLQQQFASKIEAIERQKDLIKQSIKEVETLFNSRMDYYFS